jgi:hypothetical protein
LSEKAIAGRLPAFHSFASQKPSWGSHENSLNPSLRTILEPLEENWSNPEHVGENKLQRELARVGAKADLS